MQISGKSIYYAIVTTLTKRIRSRTNELVDTHKGETGIVLVNGASLLDVPIGRLSKYTTFGCNHLPRHPDFGSLKLKYYSQVDPIWRRAKKGNDPIDPVRSQLEELQVSTDPGHTTVGFFHWSQYGTVRPYLRTTLSEAYFFENAHNDAREWIGDLSAPNPFTRGSAYFLLALALAMGCKELYILGAGYACHPIHRGHFYDDKTTLDRIARDYTQEIEPMHLVMRGLADRFGARIVNVVADGYESPVYDSVTTSEFISLMKL